MTATLKVKGLSELQKFLDKLPAKLEANIMRGALREGANVIKDEAKTNAPVGEPNRENVRLYGGYKGAMRDSVRVSTRINKRTKKVTASIKVGGESKRTGADVFYSHIVEFGASPHSVTKNGKGPHNHPGIAPQPFMRPALDNKSSEAIKAAGEYIKKRLMTKHGIDTSDIIIEVEE